MSLIIHCLQTYDLVVFYLFEFHALYKSKEVWGLVLYSVVFVTRK